MIQKFLPVKNTKSTPSGNQNGNWSSFGPESKARDEAVDAINGWMNSLGKQDLRVFLRHTRRTNHKRSNCSEIPKDEKVVHHPSRRLSDFFIETPLFQERIPETPSEWRAFRRRRSAEIDSDVEKSMGSNSGSWLEIAQQASDEACTPSGERLDVCKHRYAEKMHEISSLAAVSPLKKIPAERAITYCASQVGMGSMDAQAFADLLEGLVNVMDASKWIGRADIMAVFDVLDFDDTGVLAHSHWISAIPLFFDGSIDISAAVFREIDDDSSGFLDMQEFAKYTTPVVHMLVPKEDAQLREQMKEHLARSVFKAIDIDESGTLSPEEFKEWSQKNSLPAEAFQALDDCVKGKQIISAEVCA